MLGSLKGWLDTIAARLILLSSLSVLIIQLTAALFSLSQQFKDAEQLISEQLALSEERIKKTLSPAIWNFDYETAQQIIDSEAKTSGVAAIKVSTILGGHVIMAGTEIADGADPYEFTLSYADAEIAYLSLQKDLSPLQQLREKAIVTEGLKALILVVVLALVIVLVARHYISKPLQHLEHSMHLLSSESPLSKLEVGTANDEVSRVSREFNTIIERIELLVDSMNDQNAELSSTLENLKDLQNKLVESEKMAALGSLVAGVAHEVNTPVGIGVTASTTMLEDLKVLEREFKDRSLTATAFQKHITELNEGAQLIYKNLVRVSNLIASFKQVAVDQSIDDSRMINLHEYVEEVLSSIKPRFKHDAIEFVNQVDPTIDLVVQPGFLAQILTNLVINACLHAFDAKGGQVRVETTDNQSEDWVELSVSDNGYGMPESIRSRVFEPFVTTKRNHGGTGLGAHIVFNLVTQHMGGFIHCASEPDLGTQFVFSISRHLGDVQ